MKLCTQCGGRIIKLSGRKDMECLCCKQRWEKNGDALKVTREGWEPITILGEEPLTMVDLFSGIGGFSQAATWAGFEPVLACEIDQFCMKIYAKHFPGVPIYPDIRSLHAKAIRRYTGYQAITLVTGGFPCQDISYAGKGKGIEGEKSRLWEDMFRVISVVQPHFVLVENSPALLKRGMDRVLGDLSYIGYDAEWEVIPASFIGAPHRRDRLYIISYPNGLLWGKRMGLIFDRAAPLYESYRKECQGLWMETSCPAPGMDDGVSGKPYRHRAKAIGNAVVRQVVYPVLKTIAEIAPILRDEDYEGLS